MLIVISLAGFVMGIGARAATAPWPEVPYRYLAHRFTLMRVLKDFSNSFGLSLSLDSSISGVMDGEYSAATPSQFLNSVASSYGLNWYYQEGVLHISKATVWSSRILRVGRSDVGALRAELGQLGVIDERFGWAEFPERGVVIVSGPGSYVDKISEIVASVGSAPSDGRQVRVFPLRHARADDYTFDFRDRRIATAGVATILRTLAAGAVTQAHQGANLGSLSVAAPPPVPLPPAPLPASGARLTMAAIPPLPTLPSFSGAVADDKATMISTVQSSTGSVSSSALLPIIESDTRLNAIVIYDAPEKMPIWDALIRQLDVGVPQIQIESMIVDIDTDSVDRLGVSWETRVGDASFGFGDRGNQATVLSVNSDSFFARVHALSMTGDVRILGRPAILTIDNLAAVLSLSRTVYVSLKGERAGLVPVTTGTQMKVIPRLIDEDGRRVVSLAIDIQDGQIHQTRQKDSMPTVVQGNIDTQAVVGDGDSLLIGGYFLDEQDEDEQKVPWLGDLPLIGGLFRDRATNHKQHERLFIIRPHVIYVGSGSGHRAVP